MYQRTCTKRTLRQPEKLEVLSKKQMQALNSAPQSKIKTGVFLLKASKFLHLSQPMLHKLD